MDDEKLPRCCGGAEPKEPARRNAIKRTAVLTAYLCTRPIGVLADDEKMESPQIGDLLVRADSDNREPLRVTDLQPDAKPLHAFPQSAATGVVRDGSRLNKIMLLRIHAAQMDDVTQRNAAGDVVAYSAVCVHQGCDISEYLKKDRELLCFCHFSRYSPYHAGEVMGGPAPRSLPQLPIHLEGERLVVAGSFTAKPGVKHSA